MTDFNLARIIALYRRYAKLFWIIFLSIFAATIAATFLTKPRYEAKAQILVEARQSIVFPRSEGEIVNSVKGADMIDTHVEALYNPEIARRVIEKLKTAGKLNSETVEKLVENIKIYRSGETYLINIAYLSDDPVQAARIVNSYAQNYIELQTEVKRKEAENAAMALSERINEMAQALQNAENQVQRYKISNGLMSVNGTTLAEQTVAAIDSDLARARADENAALGRLTSARNSGARTGGAQTSALENLLSRQAVAEQDWQEASQNYGSQHPRYQDAKTKLATLNHAISREKQRARNISSASYQQDLDQLTAEAQAASGKRASLEASISDTQRALSSTNKAQVQLNALHRDAEAKRAVYEAYLARYQEAVTQLGGEQPGVSIALLASQPSQPVEPNMPVKVIFGSFAGFVLALSTVGLVSNMKTTFSTPAEVEKYLDIDSLPSLPEMEAGNLLPDYFFQDKQTAFSEQYSKLLAAIKPKSQVKGATVFAITSALSDEGKTITALMLAREARLSGQNYLLLDCTHRIENEAGINDSNLNISTLDSKTVHDHHAMEKLLNHHRDKYDLVILNLLPVLLEAGTLKIASLADKAILLCRWRTTPRKAVEDSLRILAKGGVTRIAVALSRVDWFKQVREGYGDPVFHTGRYNRSLKARETRNNYLPRPNNAKLFRRNCLTQDGVITSSP